MSTSQDVKCLCIQLRLVHIVDNLVEHWGSVQHDDVAIRIPSGSSRVHTAASPLDEELYSRESGILGWRGLRQ